MFFRGLLIWVICFVTCLRGVGENASGSQSGVSALPVGWKVGIFRVGPGFMQRIAQDAGIAEIEIVPAPAASSLGRQWDVRPWVERSGLTLPAGAIARWDYTKSNLVVFAPADVVEAIESMTLGFEPDEAWNIKIDATLVEFQVHRIAEIQALPYDRIRSYAGPSWRELEHLSVTTRDGQRAVVRNRGKASADSPTEVARAVDEMGSELEVEPVTDPDQVGLSLNLHWSRHVGSVSSRADDLDLVTTLKVRAGTSAIAGMWPAPEGPGNSAPVRTLALMIHADFVDNQGTPRRPIVEKRNRDFSKPSIDESGR